MKTVYPVKERLPNKVYSFLCEPTLGGCGYELKEIKAESLNKTVRLRCSECKKRWKIILRWGLDSFWAEME